MTPPPDDSRSGPRIHHEVMRVPWKVVTTVISVSILAVGAMSMGHTELASAAVGAVVGYLGKLNGTSDG